jgi:hypothetical protein
VCHFVHSSDLLSTGSRSLALDHALKGLAYSETTHGPYSETTLQGLVVVGEIYELMGDHRQSTVYYKRALTSVERLFWLHPLVGRLGCKLYLLLSSAREVGQEEAAHYLKKGFEAYMCLYNREDAWLMVSLLALENYIPIPGRGGRCHTGAVPWCVCVCVCVCMCVCV